MNNAMPSQVQVTIMGKPYKIACPPGQEDALRRAAAHVTGKMQEITDSGQVIGLDKVAVFAALNIAHEFLQRDADVDAFAGQVSRKINALAVKIDAVLPEADQPTQVLDILEEHSCRSG